MLQELALIAGLHDVERRRHEEHARAGWCGMDRIEAENLVYEDDILDNPHLVQLQPAFQ